MLLSGGNQIWYSFKSSLIEHLKYHLTRSGGQFHFKAKQFEYKTKKLENETIQANTIVVSAAIEVAKMKTAALSFEHFLGFLTFSGVDVGNIGHSRLQFPDIIKAAYIYLIQKMKQYMVKPLPSTGMPPHFSVAVDISTPHRETNHAVMVIVPINGIRVALPLDAEVVYKISDVGTTALTGGTGSELADQVFKSLNNSKGVL